MNTLCRLAGILSVLIGLGHVYFQQYPVAGIFFTLAVSIGVYIEVYTLGKNVNKLISKWG